jgi:hypothetical protein
MSEYMFGGGPGHLPAKAEKIARRHGATIANTYGDGCLCGYGCRPHSCPAAKRHWFAAPNRGEPFDRQTSRAVAIDLIAAGIKIDPISFGIQEAAVAPR